MEDGPFKVNEYSSLDKETLRIIMERSTPEIIAIKQSVEKILKDVKERGHCRIFKPTNRKKR